MADPEHSSLRNSIDLLVYTVYNMLTQDYSEDDTSDYDDSIDSEDDSDSEVEKAKLSTR